MAEDVIIACDFTCADETFAFLEGFGSEKPFLKIGMELYYSEGPQIVRELKSRGYKIFLDLKLHDIPNSVKSAMKVLARLDVDICNVHAAGTSQMMRAALEGALKPDGSRTKVIAVTMLTSTDQRSMQEDILIDEPIREVVMRYAENVKKSGLDGVVCSPLEVPGVRERCGEDFITVTPGIRFADGDAGDQKRFTTPDMAKQLGSDYIVVGRPITKAKVPLEAYRRCLKEFKG